MLAFENLGTTVFYGRHVAVGSRPDLNTLARAPWLSPRSRAAFRSALNNLTELGALPTKLQRYVIVDEAANAPAQHAGIWTIPVSELAEAAFVSDPEIMGEHVDDAELTLETANHYRFHAGYKSLSVFARPVGGGGSTMAAQFRRRIQAVGALCICIADSDRKFPAGPIGATAAACLAEIPGQMWRCILLVMPVREMENILPVDWIERTQTGHQMPDAMAAIRLLDQHQAILFRQHSDLKIGIVSCDHVRNADANISVRSFAELVALSGGVALAVPCAQHGACQNGGACFAVAGLGGTIPRQVASWLKSCPMQESSAIGTQSPISDLAREVFEYAVAQPAMRL